MILASAFGLDSTFGAIIGSAVMWGVKRGVYSNGGQQPARQDGDGGERSRRRP